MLLPQKYLVPHVFIEHIYEVKKSRFIARIDYASNREQALRILEQAKVDYPDARHHCWAYLIGDPKAPKTMAASDDGEPSGTAGKPILNVLQHKNVGDLMLVVIRYFGGIKLGAGGLVRAYSSAAQLAMDHLVTQEYNEIIILDVITNFATEQLLRHWLTLHDGRVLSVDYSHQVNLNVELKCEDLSALKQYFSSYVDVTFSE